MMRRRVLVALLAAALLIGCSRRPAGPPNLVVVVIDTLRADRLGVYGDRHGLTPFLDQLAGRGARFANAYAASSWTMPSVASLFTSRYPSQHQVTTLESKLSDDEATLAEALAAHGYVPAGFTANFHLSQDLGYAQGFATWTAFVSSQPGAVKVRGDELRRGSEKWLDVRQAQQPPPTAPLFLYYQFMEPHGPYDPVEPFRSRLVPAHDPAVATQANAELQSGDLWGLPPDHVALLAELYNAEVAAADEQIRLLYADLERRHLLDNTVVVITADHGEEFGERGSVGHGFTLYNEQLRVPLLVVGPDIAPHVIEEPVSLVDLAPTLLAIAGVPAPPSVEGRSLLPLLREAAPAPAKTPVDVIAELERPGQKADLRTHNAAVIRGTLKLLRSTDLTVGAQLFDLAHDAGETSPNPAALLAQRDELRSALFDREIVLRVNREVKPETVELDDPTREKLRALGYHSD